MSRSIVLVTVDCLRADHVGFMGYPRETTPFLDSLARESLVIPAAIVAGAPTYYSFPAILASRYPLALGRDVLGFAPEETTIATMAKENGYATAAFSAGNPYISSRFGYARGFDVFRDFLTSEPQVPTSGKLPVAQKHWVARINQKLQRARNRMGPLRFAYDEIYFQYCQRVTPIQKSLDALRRFPAADEIVDAACSWLKSADNRPFFLWLHLMDPHSPYYPKENALELMEEEPLTPFRARYLNSYWNRSDLGARRLERHRDEIVKLYDAGIRWVDSQLQRLVQWLKDAKRWDDCIFTVTADHGEEFLDHGGRYHPPSDLHEELIHAPLLMRIPDTRPRMLGHEPFSLVDLAPTLVHAAQIQVPPSFQGVSRLAQWSAGTGRDSVAISEAVCCTNPFRIESRLKPRILSIREKRFKLIVHFENFAGRLYDLESDPRELAPLPPSAEKAARRRLMEIGRDHIQRSLKQRDELARVGSKLRERRIEWEISKPQSARA